MTDNAVPQRTVEIHLEGLGTDAVADYTYTSPYTHEYHEHAPNCDLVNKLPTNVLFFLDYDSTLNGWTIVNITPNPSTAPLLQNWLGPQGQSLVTYDPCTTETIYSFYINYENTITGAVVSIDPQEGSVPPG